MKKLLDTMAPRPWGAFFLLSAVAVLATVYVSQYGFGLHPCHLCHLQRLPYFLATVLALALALVPMSLRTAKILFGLLAVTFATSIGLGMFHLGVENKWWIYESGCTGAGLLTPGGSTADFLAALKKAPVARCDEPVVFLFGLSMAFYNVLVSGVLTAVALVALIRPANRT